MYVRDVGQGTGLHTIQELNQYMDFCGFGFLLSAPVQIPSLTAVLFQKNSLMHMSLVLQLVCSVKRPRLSPFL